MKQALEHNKIPTNHPKMVRETCRISLLTFAEEFERPLFKFYSGSRATSSRETLGPFRFGTRKTQGG